MEHQDVPNNSDTQEVSHHQPTSSDTTNMHVNKRKFRH